jgi:hypothetical protein
VYIINNESMVYNKLMDYTNSGPLIGKAGELRVRSELLLRGLSGAAFDQDMGVDVIVSNGKRLQIKTAIKPSLDKKAYSWRYSFSIRQPQVRGIGDGLYSRKYNKRDYSEVVDYFVLWCVEDNVFYIIPEGQIGAKVSIAIATPERLRTYKLNKKFKSTSKYEQYKNNWEQLL